MPYADNGVKIYYEVEDGGEPAIVFVHGWTANMNFWREQREYFKGKHRMLFIDNRGHGKSDKPFNRSFYEFDNFVSDLHAAVKDAGFDRFVLVGHSFGTMISMRYCVEHPGRVEVLVLIGGGARIQSLHRYGYPIGRLFATLAYGISARIVANMAFGRKAGELRDWGLKEALENTPKHAALNTLWTLTTVDLRDIAREIEKPTLIVVGKEDALLPVSKSEELSRLIKNSKMVIVPDAGHCVMLEQPEIVNRVLEEFIHTFSAMLIRA
ncbi:putative hydrolase or acyltransferase (alpha/beta hydrolase superfamily) [Archaeoglobus fulgidus DSM 8774]|uniref:Putative hydrolase or acyltransferase (Alpha/beta hydrolase superfamily) n=1 Tax=Archaeoglobus fulgidus DSM 8774 TaxID=1344584 RepID=A0A075WBE9_ARCFL|nr:alpha/beta hydrolase [Archaeoglobus fulgidus]AIG97740.1 putative hydrolase or acyltransferase (alpha/beta hydrolase superfamily) [Archaeoglobus fulgidus DSM 8774]